MSTDESAIEKTRQYGGCLCGSIRYSVSSAPYGINICTCHFCQKMTGSDYMVEPVFRLDEFKLEEGKPEIYEHVSAGSGHKIHVHFCGNCGTTLFHLFERFENCVGVFPGTFDNPDWFERNSETVDYVFLESATRGTVIPPGYRTFPGHLINLEGELLEPQVLDDFLVIDARVESNTSNTSDD